MGGWGARMRLLGPHPWALPIGNHE